MAPSAFYLVASSLHHVDHRNHRTQLGQSKDNYRPGAFWKRHNLARFDLFTVVLHNLQYVCAFKQNELNFKNLN